MRSAVGSHFVLSGRSSIRLRLPPAEDWVSHERPAPTSHSVRRGFDIDLSVLEVYVEASLLAAAKGSRQRHNLSTAGTQSLASDPLNASENEVGARIDTRIESSSDSDYEEEIANERSIECLGIGGEQQRRNLDIRCSDGVRVLHADMETKETEMRIPLALDWRLSDD